MSATISRLVTGGKGLPCCGLASLAIVTQVPLPICYIHYRQRYNKPKQWRGSTNYYNIITMAELYGLTLKHVKRADMDRGRTIENYLLDNPNTYALIRTDRHMQVAMGTSIYDQGGAKHILEHWGRNKYIQDVIHILGADDNKFSLDYRALLLVTEGVCNTLSEARQLFATYGKV